MPPPPPPPLNPTPPTALTDAEFAALHARRLALLELQHRGPYGDAESAEWNRLRSEIVAELVRRGAPVPLPEGGTLQLMRDRLTYVACDEGGDPIGMHLYGSDSNRGLLFDYAAPGRFSTRLTNEPFREQGRPH